MQRQQATIDLDPPREGPARYSNPVAIEYCGWSVGAFQLVDDRFFSTGPYRPNMDFPYTEISKLSSPA